jgi:hypothetical protein
VQFLSDSPQDQPPAPGFADLLSACVPVRHPWFAVRVRFNYERITSTILRGKGYDYALKAPPQTGME